MRWSYFFGQEVKVYSRALRRHWNEEETATFKKRVALAALRGDRTIQAIAAQHEVHPNQVSTWKRQAIEGLEEVFFGGGSKRPSEQQATIRDLHAKIGELTVERDFFLRGFKR